MNKGFSALTQWIWAAESKRKNSTLEKGTEIIKRSITERNEHRTERKEDGGCIMKPMNEHGMLNKKKIDSILF